MPIIQAYHNFFPSIADSAFIADNSTIIGEVEIGPESSIWFNAVIRGDAGAIKIGSRTNIQDGVIIHATTDRCGVNIGDDVVVGHRAILHACTIEDEVLIGMGAIVLDESIVPKHTIIAAGALVPEGKALESRYLYAGVPVKKIKPLGLQHIKMIRQGAIGYVEKGQWYKSNMIQNFD